MRRSLSIIVFLAFLFVACGPSEVVKHYICPDDKPYLNDVDNLCYSSKEAADAANAAKENSETPANPSDPAQPTDPAQPVDPELPVEPTPIPAS